MTGFWRLAWPCFMWGMCWSGLSLPPPICSCGVWTLWMLSSLRILRHGFTLWIIRQGFCIRGLWQYNSFRKLGRSSDFRSIWPSFW